MVGKGVKNLGVGSMVFISSVVGFRVVGSLVSLPTPPLEFSVWASSNHCAAGEGPSAPELKNLTTKIGAPKVVKVVYKTYLRLLCA